MLLVSSGVVAVLLVGGFILLFVGSWVLNHRTKIPEGCKVNKPECTGCSILTCPSRKVGSEEVKEEIVKTIDMDREAKEELEKNMKK